MREEEFKKFKITKKDDKLFVEVEIKIQDDHKHKNKVIIYCSGVQYVLKQKGYKIIKVLNGRNLYNTSDELRQHKYVFQLEEEPEVIYEAPKKKKKSSRKKTKKRTVKQELK